MLKPLLFLGLLALAAPAYAEEDVVPAAPTATEDELSLPPEASTPPDAPESIEALATTPEEPEPAFEEPPAAEEASEVTEAPAPEPLAEDTSIAQFEVRRTPLYKLHRPKWGVELAGSAAGFGAGAELAGRTDLKVRALGFQIEYQPTFLQAIGVLGIGPSFGLYPPIPVVDDAALLHAHYYVGGQARYQLRPFREQPLVPMIGYAAEFLSYRYQNGANGRLLLQGPVFGAYLLLNWLEPSAAADMFTNYGVSRSYLVAEIRMLTGSDSNIDVPGQGLFFGLRIEY